MKYLPTTPFQLAGGLAILMSSSVLADNKVQFNIPAQSLSQSLLDYSQITGIKILFNENLARNIKNPALNGDYTTEEALKKLLGNSGLDYHFTSPKAVVLNQPKAENQSEAPVSAEAKNEAGTITLPKVNVVGNTVNDVRDPYNEDYVLPNATAGTKTDTPIMETPLNIQVISKQVLKDQQVTRLDQALKNVSGVTTDQGYAGLGGTNQQITLRGFASEIYFRNGFRQQNGSSQREMANVESVEVLKGSAAILYGLVEPGGMVNVITKQPLETPYYSAQQQFGSYNLYRTTVDATGPITKDDTLLYRMNMSYENSGTFRDLVPNTERVFVAPTLKWNISPRTQVTAELEYNHDNIGLDAQFVPTYNGQFINMPRSRNYGEPATGNVDTIFGGINWSHQFNDDWSIKHSSRASTHTMLRTLVYPGPPMWSPVPNTIDQNLIRYNHQNNTYSTNLDLTGHFATWGMKHTLLLGGDYYRDDYIFLDNSNSNYALDNFLDPLNPVHSTLPNAGLVLDPTTKYTATENTDQYGLYMQDQIELPYHVHFTGGIRYQYLHQKNVYNYYNNPPTYFSPLTADAVTPRFGLLWRPQDWLSIYSNYAENFGPNFGWTYSGSAIPPSGAQQWEVGTKTEFFDGRLRATLAYYDLTKQNVPTADMAHPGFSIVAGEVHSRGPELDIQGEILPGWNAIATYANTNILVSKASNDPSNYPAQGSRYFGVPRNTASLWNTYEFQHDDLRGFKIGGGVTLRDSQLANTGGTMNNPFIVPGYATVDLLAAYSMKFGKSKVSAQLNVNNLLDKHYYSSASFAAPPQSTGFDGGWVNIGMPRSLIGSIKVEF